MASFLPLFLLAMLSPSSTMSSSGCRTINADLCIFPFIYKGQTFSSCTDFESVNGLQWCATKVRNNKVVVKGRWADCDMATCASSNIRFGGEVPLTKDPDESTLPCQFTHECRRDHQQCTQIQDAGCVCNHGSCIIRGNPFVRDSDRECTSYTDCSCRNNKDRCYCIEGFCENIAWECHEDNDCNGMSKCQGKECTCQESRCEWNCNVDSDCTAGQFYCDWLGYECKCQRGQCDSVRLPAECNTISDCVKLGKCAPNKPCECSDSYSVCTKPWYARYDRDHQQCRPEKGNQDCTETVLDCADGSCSCTDIVKRSEWESYGRCTK